MSNIKLVTENLDLAKLLAEKFPQFSFSVKSEEIIDTAVFGLNKDKIGIFTNDQKPLFLSIDFLDSELQRRRKFFSSKKEPLLKAVGAKAQFPRVFDGTAGLGRESYLLASHGYEVNSCEKNPYLYVLLSLALERLYTNLDLPEDKKRLFFHFGDSLEVLQALSEAIDVLYMDPMFPETKKSALVKKNMQVLQRMDLSDDKPLELLEKAKTLALKRIVFKRPKQVSILDESSLKEYYENDTIRFEVY